MIKGVNKQIIEVVNTDNEFFEKAILFVNPSKMNASEQEKIKKADDYVKEFTKNTKTKQKRKSKKWVISVVEIAGAALAGATIASFVIKP
ncbi:MAG: hypothetical protein K0R90_478 [Oscillospiraceae bacterium]|nr:hypothetical protein [Oscillospiraceae bacterium]